MPVTAPVAEESIESKIRRAFVKMLRANTSLATRYTIGSLVNIKSEHVLVEDDLIRVPQLTVQNVPERDSFNRMLGGFSQPMVHLMVLMFEAEDVGEIPAGELTAIDYIVMVERIAEAGSDLLGTGKLYDPDMTPAQLAAAPPVTRYLTTKAPQVTRQGAIIRDTSTEQDQSSIAVLYPTIYSYETQQNRNTRRQQ